MARLSVNDLPFPLDRFRIDLCTHVPAGKHPFETEESAREEDARRMVLVRRTALIAQQPENRSAATSLSAKLDYDPAGDPTGSCASSLHMRDQRIRFIGALWKVIGEKQ